MKILGFEIQRRAPNAEHRTPNGSSPRLSDEEMAAALAMPEKDPRWRAMLQLLGDFEESARKNIGTDPNQTGLVTWNAGGAEYLALFKEELMKRRSQALAGFRVDPRKLARVAVSSGMRDAAGRRPEDEE